mmetsp:Transcript_23011/g.60573  ORF Transcript_23011/g.60573 Transcript_23011/m.60573 type:complete len:203 (-) Transcript_23011:120-728(-)
MVARLTPLATARKAETMSVPSRSARPLLATLVVHRESEQPFTHTLWADPVAPQGHGVMATTGRVVFGVHQKILVYFVDVSLLGQDAVQVTSPAPPHVLAPRSVLRVEIRPEDPILEATAWSRTRVVEMLRLVLEDLDHPLVQLSLKDVIRNLVRNTEVLSDRCDFHLRLSLGIHLNRSVVQHLLQSIVRLLRKRLQRHLVDG